MTTFYRCPVCGFNGLKEDPKRFSEEICPSCGFQFGWSFSQGYTYESWRKEWISTGMKWFSAGIEQPADWNPIANLDDLDLRSGEP